MTTESELKDLLRMIGDQAPTADDTLNRLTLAAVSSAPAPRSHRRWLPIGAVVAVVAASIAVSVVVRGDNPSDGGTAAGPPVDRASYPMPLDACYASATQQRTLERAQFVLAQRCAQAHGVPVPTAVIPAADPRPDFLMTIANDVRPLTLEQARTIGYDLYPSGTAAYPAVIEGLTPPQLEIYRGWSSDLKLPKPTGPFLLAGGATTRPPRPYSRGRNRRGYEGSLTPTDHRVCSRTTPP